MPVIFREKGYEFSFVMFDLSEPIHVHIRSGAKIAWKRGYRPHELNEIERIIRDRETLIREVWQREGTKTDEYDADYNQYPF